MNYIRVLGIDPGVETCGISILDLVNLKEIHVLHAETIITERLLFRYKFLSELHGDRHLKQRILMEEITRILSEYLPYLVIIEDSYYNPKRPQAYASLKELIALIKHVIFSFSVNIPSFTIESASVKKLMGVPGNCGDKEIMKDALIKQDISYESPLSICQLDEHSIDSIATGYWACKNINNLIRDGY